MNKKHLPNSYRAKASNTAVYLMKHCTISEVHDSTPHEKLYGNKSDLSHVRIFSSIAFVHVPDEKRQKLDPKSEKCILVGYSIEQKGYKCFNHSTKKGRVSLDVVFDESSSLVRSQLNSIWSNRNRFRYNQFIRRWLTNAHKRGKSDLNRVEWTIRASERPKHVVSSLEQDKGKAKIHEYEDSDGNKYSLDIAYGGLDVLSMRTPGAPHHSTREKNVVADLATMTTWHIIMHSWWRWWQSESRKHFPKLRRTRDGSKRWTRRCKHSPKMRHGNSSPLHPTSK